VLGLLRSVGFALLLFFAFSGVPASFGQNPLPLINDPLVPASTAPGGAGFTLTVNGTGFVTGAVVKWNGSPRTTHFVNGSQVTATIPASDIVTAGTASITVTNPSPGGASNVAYFEITNTASTLTFAELTMLNGFVPRDVGQSVAVVDFNGDGKLDLAIPQPTNVGTDSVAILLAKGDGSFAPAVNYHVGGLDPEFVIAGDFNGDGKLDLATSNFSDSSVTILLGNGDGTFQTQATYSFNVGPLSGHGLEPWALVAGDFNGDGKLDLAVTLQYANGVAILLGNGDGSFQNPVEYATVPGPVGIVVGDFNRDGKLDLIIPSLQNGATLLLGNGDGTFQAQGTVGTGVVAAIATADLNHDGKLDLVTVADEPTSTLDVLLGNGDGTFQNAVTYPVGGSNATDLGIGDVNADGNLDLIVPCGGSLNLSVLLGNGDGTFQSPTNVSATRDVNGFAVGDFNGDGKLDIVLPFASTGGSVGTFVMLLQGLFPTLTATPDGLSFPQQAIGTTGTPQTMTLTNSGMATLSITTPGIGIAGVTAGDFSQTNNCPSTLAIGASCEVTVTYTPTGGGERDAAVSVTDNVPGSPQLIPLGGQTPPAPIVGISPATVVFPSQYVGTSGLPQTLTVTNTGFATLSITSATGSPADFGVLSNCTNPVVVGSNCTIGVFFDPTAGGTRTGTLTITDNAMNSPQTITLKGTGQDFSVTPSAASSATVSPGQTAGYALGIAPAGGFTQSVTLTCSGAPAQSTCSVSPSTISLSGTSPTTAMVTVTTTAGSSGLTLPVGVGGFTGSKNPQRPLILAWLCALLLTLASLGFLRRAERMKWVPYFVLAVLVCLSVTLTSCGGGSGGGGGGGTAGTQAGTYTISVSGNFTSGSTTLTHAAKLTLVVQ
jgi:hypothetical protein